VFVASSYFGEILYLKVDAMRRHTCT